MAGVGDADCYVLTLKIILFKTSNLDFSVSTGKSQQRIQLVTTGASCAMYYPFLALPFLSSRVYTALQSLSEDFPLGAHL